MIRKRFLKSLLVLMIATLLFMPVLNAKTEKTRPLNMAGFPAFVEKLMKDHQAPGIAIAVVQNGQVVYARGFGYRDVEKKLPVTTDTLFAIGSCSKAFTATVLGILVDEGKLEWEKPVRSYLPDFKLQDSVATEQMTAVDLLCHRSGLPRHDMVWYGSNASRDQLFQRLHSLEPSKSFRSAFQYNNLMVMTAGYMAGKIAGTSWEDLVQKKLFDPLGMKTSNFSVTTSQKSQDFALPYSIKEEKLTAIPFRNIDNVGPAGSINSSVNEMTRWLLLNLDKGKYQEKQIVSQASMTQIHAPHMVVDAPLGEFPENSFSSYGLGWALETYRGHPLIEHGGGIDGFIAEVAILPRENAGIVILTNSDGGGSFISPIIAYNLYDRLLGLPQVPWAQRFNERREKRKKAAEEQKNKKDETRKLNTTPSHPLEDYAGEYEHPGYGSILFEKKDATLTATYNNIPFTTQHYHYDVFQLSNELLGDEKIKAAFHTDIKGNIQKVTIPLEATVKDIEFTRAPAKKWLEKAYIEKFVGAYQLDAITMTVSLVAENTLLLNVPGQPQYTLVPEKENEFALKGLTGFTIKFILSETGEVTALESHQPNGVFTAKKRK